MFERLFELIASWFEPLFPKRKRPREDADLNHESDTTAKKRRLNSNMSGEGSSYFSRAGSSNQSRSWMMVSLALNNEQEHVTNRTYNNLTRSYRKTNKTEENVINVEEISDDSDVEVVKEDRNQELYVTTSSSDDECLININGTFSKPSQKRKSPGKSNLPHRLSQLEQRKNSVTSDSDLEYVGTLDRPKCGNGPREVCNSPVLKRDGVEFVGIFKKTSENATQTPGGHNHSSLDSRNHVMRRKSWSNLLSPSRSPFNFPSNNRRQYHQLVGSVLKDPDLFRVRTVTPKRINHLPELIDLTKTDSENSEVGRRRKGRTSGSVTPKMSSSIDLTQPSTSSSFVVKHRDTSAIDIPVIDLDTAPVKGREVTPRNTFKSNLKNVPYVPTDYVDTLQQEISKIRKQFEEGEEFYQANVLLEKKKDSWMRILEDRMKRHMTITQQLTSSVLQSELEEEEPKLPELSPDMLKRIENAWDPRKPGSQVLVENFNYKITRADLSTLSKLNWLNDEVINFYMTLIFERGKQKDFTPVYTFNTFFYQKLFKDGHSGVRRWTRKVDIFSFDILIAPIHLQVHWTLAAVDFKKKTISYYDSMGVSNQKCLDAFLQYLVDEKMDKKKEVFDKTGWKTVNTKDIPLQMNSCDCGVFSCTFAEYIAREAQFTFSQDDMQYFRKKICYEILTSKLLDF